MKTKLILSILALGALTVFNSCSKDGVAGPAGPQGPQGIPGINGSANLKNYDITVTPSQWTYDNLYKRWYYRYYTSDNAQSAVLGYVISGSGKQVIPYYESTNSFQIDIATNLFASPAYIEFQYTNLSSNSTAPSNNKYLYLVIIPPAIKAKHPNTDWNNYNEVIKVMTTECLKTGYHD